MLPRLVNATRPPAPDQFPVTRLTGQARTQLRPIANAI
jgi:hypothetical protein